MNQVLIAWMRLKAWCNKMGASSFTLRIVFFTALAAFLLGCGTARDRQKIRQGLLVTELRRDAFLKEWGLPTKTYTEAGDSDGLKAIWGNGGNKEGYFALRKGRTYNVWVYEERGATLVFYRDELVTWQSTKTTQELRQPHK